jgi:hypothetical protein
MHGELQVESQTLEDALVVIKTGLALKRNQLGKLRLVLLIAQSCILFATLNEVFHINSGFVYTFPLVPLFSNGTATGTYERSSFVLSLSSFNWVTGVSVGVERPFMVLILLHTYPPPPLSPLLPLPQFFVATAGFMFISGLYCIYKLPS